ncbi:hypothetical protein ACTXGJ_02410 [Psychrobacter sp. 1Y11]|uniref:hypothetical protein n=1 Tax=Psychrobacter sp. 1Y11 TaxID=3457446 RepID=UPI003FD57CBB
MSLRLSKSLRASTVITGVFACVIGLSACQQEPETEPSLEDDIATEQAVPMSADPAEPNDTVIAPDATLNEVEDDTVASVNSGVTQITYLCAPELKVDVTYKDESNEAVLSTTKGTITVNKTNEGTNPGVYEGTTTIDGSAGFTQWRVAHQERETGVIRTSSEGEPDITTYQCDETD